MQTMPVTINQTASKFFSALQILEKIQSPDTLGGTLPKHRLLQLLKVFLLQTQKLGMLCF